ncbi:unnamed protein product [Adineta steineri]|uniref:Vacuolar protein sorting-associated protein 72 homolog n=2 Tax=Adineta steineri TaxID=433720 RepID=A0A819LF42_9BILA|nr:unnamed protein product [Adineta steineri]CAF1100074.1 unnamed protein product [Adineta steineri]CAF3681732.1 unnamed protein product [Adineta steineri]CAF3960829.1 unnamed protein product [Adineta steineri]CAF4087806.1 unnamed protein product [Adineta steineri]
MSFAAERERRQTAGNRLKRLLEQQEDPDDEFYGTAYGGFLDEEEDNDYHSEDSEEDVVDSDFDQNDEQQQQAEDDSEQTDTTKKRKNEEDSDGDETSKRKRKKVVYQAQSLQQELKAQKKEEQEKTGDSKLTRQQQKKVNTTNIEAKTLRTSTSVKRVELEKRQKDRQERRSYLKGVASLRNTREVRKLTQEELLEEAKITEEINMESLEAYQQIELKKKENKRNKLIHECPRICSSSMTILNETNDQWNDILDPSYQLEAIPERYSRTFVSFTHLQTYNDTFSKLNASNRHRRRLCPITGMPAQYFDPLTQMPYATLEAYQILRRIHAEELKKQKRTTSVLIDAQRDVNLNILR